MAMLPASDFTPASQLSARIQRKLVASERANSHLAESMLVKFLLDCINSSRAGERLACGRGGNRVGMESSDNELMASLLTNGSARSKLGGGATGLSA